MIKKIIFNLIFKILDDELKRLRKKNKHITILDVKGTGKDYPNYLLYTNSEYVRNYILNDKIIGEWECYEKIQRRWFKK